MNNLFGKGVEEVKRNVLFVCTGNTCRSPMAEAFLSSKANDSVSVRSAGVAASPGSDASSGAKQALAEFGLSKEHRARQLEAELVEWADIILTMTGSQKQLIHVYFPYAMDKVFTLKEYVDYSGDKGKEDVLDPYGQSLDKYMETAAELEELVEMFLKKFS